MNIFWLSLNPRKAAQAQVNSHVVKMPLETAQLLCSVLWLCGFAVETTETPPYKLTHKNHPCAKWARESLENYLWLVDMLEALGEEYTYRYGKQHKSVGYVSWFRENLPELESRGLTVPPCAMPDEYKINGCATFDDVIESYWWYYAIGKRHLHAWKRREVPAELQEFLANCDE